MWSDHVYRGSTRVDGVVWSFRNIVVTGCSTNVWRWALATLVAYQELPPCGMIVYTAVDLGARRCGMVFGE